MLDMAGIVAAGLRLDTEVMAAFSDRVFADVAPAGTVAPFVVVRMQSLTPLFVDVSTWQSVAVLVDVVGDPEDVPALHQGAELVRSSIAALRGTVAGSAAIQTVEPISGLFGFDPSFTPALPRWVLTASMVARSITESEGVVA